MIKMLQKQDSNKCCRRILGSNCEILWPSQVCQLFDQQMKGFNFIQSYGIRKCKAFEEMKMLFKMFVNHHIGGVKIP